MELLLRTLTPSLTAFLDSFSVLSSRIAVPMSNTLYYLQLAKRFCPMLVQFIGLYYSCFCHLLSRLKQCNTPGRSAISLIRNLELIQNSAGKCFLQQIKTVSCSLYYLKKVLSLIQGFSFCFRSI